MGKTVVIVDDEFHVRLYIRALITSMGMDVIGEAADGEDAVKVYREKRPDLLLLDMNMPGRNGEEALRDIIEEFPAANVIMLSSIADRSVVEKCLDIGAKHFIRRDCSTDEIKAIIDQILT